MLGAGILAAIASPLAAQTPATDFAANRTTTIAPTSATTLLPPVVLKLPPPRKEEQPKRQDTFPIDLPTALRLANASSPVIAIAQTRVREAYARLEQAEALRLPTISGGGIYLRHDGIDQNRKAELFKISRGSLFTGGGASLRLDLAEAIYQPLAARRLAESEAETARATTNNAQLEVVSAYLDLVQAHAQIVINADILDRAEQILKAAEAGARAGALRNAADVNRARTEVGLRRAERQDLSAKLAAASARLTKLLLLDPTVTLVPADEAAVPIELFATGMPLESLIAMAVQSRPELAAAALQQDAAETRARQARYAPFIPRVQAEYLAGGFGGGQNGAISNLESRGDLAAQVFWELRGLGLGNLADIRLRNAERDRASLVIVAARAQVAAEVVEAERAAAARKASLDDARTADKESREMFRKLSETSFGMVGPRGQFDAIEPLLAVQAMNQARLQLLSATVEYNRAQFRLFTAVGQPAEAAAVPTLPAPRP
jgi:outer membrane protein TolC